jgi:type I restriction enzyme S subunit
VQREIVRILDNFTELAAELTAELTAELAARKKQYEYYRDLLLMFGDEVPRVKLGHITTITRGVRVVKRQLSEIGTYPVFQNSVTPLGYYEKNNYPKNTVFVIGAGAAGEIGYSKVDFWAADDCFCLTCSDILQSRFLYYALLCQKDYLLSRVRRASVPRLARSVIEELIIPVPPLKEQERIVAILDHFDALCNDLTSGIPAEIEARQKQYEYYRDKLLTFKEVSA